MAGLYEFKNTNFSRGFRTQRIEENFAKGMQFTNSPLDEGYVKVMLNYDLQDSGEAVVPRPGLQTTVLMKPVDAACGYDTIIANKEQHITPTDARAQLITIAPKAGSDNYNLRVVTQTDENEDGSFDYAVSPNVEVRCTKPQEAEIHGIAVSNNTLAKIAGDYAWNEQFYFFTADNKIGHTEFSVADNKYLVTTDTAKAVTAKEAVMYGYNMLSSTPYTFSNTYAAASSIIEFEGMMPYDGTNLCLTPVVNQSLEFKVFYKVPAGTKYYITVEWKGTSDSIWNQLMAFDRTFTDLSDLNIPFSPPSENIVLRVSAYGYDGDVKRAYTDATLAVGFNFAKTEYGNTANVSQKTYSVAQATGLCYWQNRLIAWGVPEDSTILFASEVNDPTYFPYPNNCDTFSEPIKYAKPFGDNLLVYTATKLYCLTLSEDGLSWTKKCIQSNLSINDWDIHLIQTVKNMVFFRSGNYYYMMVPKATSTTGELTLASVSKPLTYFFDNFEKSVKNIVSAVYDKEVTLTLKQYYNYLDFEDVHNVYVFQTDENELLNFDVLYNTVTRYWRVYVTGNAGITKPYKQDMTQKGTLVMPVSNATDGVFYQLMRYNAKDNQDKYICQLTDNDTAFATYHVWYNWQCVDTGYREHVSNFKKRYREIQFIINNLSNKAISFYTDFFIDGEQRKNRYAYQVIQELNPEDPDYGVLTIERVLQDPITSPGATILGDNTEDTEAWVLDVSNFPDTAFWKARFPVSGKGYVPRMVFISHNELPYELLNISWVYRQLYSR